MTTHPAEIPFTNPFELAHEVPLRDRVLVLPLAAPSRTAGGLHVVENSAERERPQEGLVLSVGPGRYTQFSERLPMDLKAGDVVRYGKYAGQEITVQLPSGTLTVLNMAELEVSSRRPFGTTTVIRHDKPKDWHVQGVFCELCAAAADAEAKTRLAAVRASMVVSVDEPEPRP